MKVLYNESDNGKAFFLFNIVVSGILTYSINEFILTDNHFYNHYSNQISFETIEEMIRIRHKWSWLSYVLLPIIYAIKILFISLSIYCGLFFSIDKKIQLKEILTLVVKADLVFLIPSMIKIIWFSFSEYDLADFQKFYPLSLLNIIDESTVEQWLIYPLQTLNLFEITFWILLAYQLKRIYSYNFSQAFGLVVSSYGSSLLIWIIFMVFLTVNNS